MALDNDTDTDHDNVTMTNTSIPITIPMRNRKTPAHLVWKDAQRAQSRIRVWKRLGIPGSQDWEHVDAKRRCMHQHADSANQDVSILPSLDQRRRPKAVLDAFESIARYEVSLSRWVEIGV